MDKVIINSYEDFEKLIGQQIGVSDYLEVSQERINQIIEVNNLKMMINYGMDKMKFGQAVLSGQSVRLKASLHSLTNLRGVAKAEIKFAIEIKDQLKKALEGIAIFLYYFN